LFFALVATAFLISAKPTILAMQPGLEQNLCALIAVKKEKEIVQIAKNHFVQ
jgi:hypothetical protein